MAVVVGFDETAKKRKTCQECGAINEYLKREVQSSNHYDYGGGCDIYKYFVCGNCGEKVYL